MPSSSKKQHNFMAAIAHSPSFAKKVGVPQSVGQDFNKADKGRKFSKGGDMAKFDPKSLFKGKESMSEELKEAKAIKSGKITPMQYAKGEKSEGVHGMKKMAAGGATAAPAPAPAPKPKRTAAEEEMIQEVKDAKDREKIKDMGYARGGFVRSADGIATKGKTRGTQIAMKKGGMC